MLVGELEHILKTASGKTPVTACLGDLGNRDHIPVLFVVPQYDMEGNLLRVSLELHD